MSLLTIPSDFDNSGLSVSRHRRTVLGFLFLLLLTFQIGGCASSALFRAAQQAERQQNYDQAIADYTRAIQENPSDRDSQLALERVKLRSAETHFTEGRRLLRLMQWEDALAEFTLAYELNPTNGDVERELRATQQIVYAELTELTERQTALEVLIDKTRYVPPPDVGLLQNINLPDSVVFRDASVRSVLSALGQLGNVNVIFDPGFRDSTISVDLRNNSFVEALTSVTGSTQNFFRATAPRTITVVPDTPIKRREYEEEVVRTFYLSNADISETIDLLRLVIDLRRIAPVTATNAISIKDTPERINAAAKLLKAIDKARAEVVIEVQLLEADRQIVRDYGLPFSSPGSIGIESSIGLAESAGRTLEAIASLTGSGLFIANLPSLFVRMLESHSNTRILANPQLRTSDGVTAEARFGERVPVPVTTFTPIAAGGISQQPITSFNYENIGVNIEITPRIHHNDEVSLTLRIEISNISGTGYGDLPQFGSREITTTIRLMDGETSILAGLIRDNEREVIEGIPGLSSVPIIGRIFGRNKTETQETDIVLTLTPHVIRGLDLNEEDLLPFRIAGSPGSGVQAARTSPSSPQIQQQFSPQQQPISDGIQLPVTPPPNPIR